MFDTKLLDASYDPQEQLLIALGVHPDQQDAKSRVAEALAGGAGKPDAATPAPSAPVPSAALPDTPSTMASGESAVAPIARPNGAKPVMLPEQRLAADQSELDRLNKTGSGISQIHNKFLRGIARVGDIAGRAFFPGIESMIPGTEGHHQELTGEAQGRVASDLGTQQKQAQIKEENARAAKAQSEADAPGETKPVFDQAGDMIGAYVNGDLVGPNSPKLTPDLRDMMAAAKGKKSAAGTPEAQAMADLVTGGMKPYDAWAKIQQDKADNKPDTANQHKQEFEATLQKAIAGAGGNVDASIYTSLAKAADFIKNSAALSPEEKNKALAFIGANNTPMSTGTNTSIRVEPQNETPFNVINTQNKEMGVMTKKELAEANQKAPGKWILAGQGGTQSMAKEANADNIRTSISNVRDHTAVLDGGIKNRAVIAAALADPSNTASQFAQSAAAASLEPAEQDYVIAVLNAREQIQGLRSLLQASGNSDKRIAAMIRTLPGASTPSSAFANKQIDTALADIDRELKGVPKVRNKEGNKSAAQAPSGLTPEQQKRDQRFGVVYE